MKCCFTTQDLQCWGEFPLATLTFLLWQWFAQALSLGGFPTHSHCVRAQTDALWGPGTQQRNGARYRWMDFLVVQWQVTLGERPVQSWVESLLTTHVRAAVPCARLSQGRTKLYVMLGMVSPYPELFPYFCFATPWIQSLWVYPDTWIDLFFFSSSTEAISKCIRTWYVPHVSDVIPTLLGQC